MRASTAQTILDGRGWYWPPNSRKAHFYLADHRTACGRGLVLALPDDLEPIGSSSMLDDCAGCRRKVSEALALDPKPGDSGSRS